MGLVSAGGACHTDERRAPSPAGRPDERFPRELYRRYRGPLLRYALSMVNGDRLVAEDVVQETMLRAWLHADELDSEQAAPWLYTVAYRVAVSLHHRRRRARPDEVPLTDASGQLTEGSADQVVDSVVVRAALGRLGAEHREVLVQLHYLQRSVAQVADDLRIPAGTVRSRAFYGLRELRAILEDEGVAGS